MSEQKKRRMDRSMKMEEKDAAQDAYLLVNLKNLSHLKSWFAKEHPNYSEGNYINREEVDKKELKMGFGRIKRIAANVNLQINSINEIFRFKYPRLSYLCLFVNLISPFSPLKLRRRSPSLWC